jgi:hypothetical protein
MISHGTIQFTGRIYVAKLTATSASSEALADTVCQSVMMRESGRLQIKEEKWKDGTGRGVFLRLAACLSQ